jgi:uncharacterized membrane protein HdeD (DUF308 family)
MDAAVRALSQDWWIFLMEGVLAIIFGLLLLFWPGPTAGVVIVLVGLFALLSGIVGVFAAIGAAGNQQPWGWRLTTALLGILVGLAIMRWPGATAVVILYLVAFWLILGGVVGIVESFAAHRMVSHAWLLLLSSVVAILFGIAMFAWPTVTLTLVVRLIGIYAIVQGIVLCALAFQVRRSPERLLGETDSAPSQALPSM